MPVFWVEVIGWIAAFATLSAYSMRTMLPLRIAAIFANLSFATYGALAEVYPAFVLHVVLLPFNCYRLWEILRDTREMEKARGEDSIAINALRPLLKSKWYEDGDYIFRKGDAPDHLYILGEGTVLLEEIEVTLGSEEVFGEIAFFTDARERTLSARCVGRCEILRVNEADFMRLYSQSPGFGLYMMRLVSSRLLDGISRRPQAYLPQGAE